jgi:hypothetical protein
MSTNREISRATLRSFAEFNDRRDERVVVLEYSPVLRSLNEMLFFLKPEATISHETVSRVIKVVLHAFDKFKISITSSLILRGTYLDRHGLMQKHYGVINVIAREGRKALSDVAKRMFYQKFGCKPEGVNMLGGLEFLREFPQFDADSLNHLWEEGGNLKLAGGTYCKRVEINGNAIYILNGFHPSQIQHFVAPVSSLVIFVVQTDTAWLVCRDDMLGATNPLQARIGSIRRILLERAPSIGIKEVSQSYNCLHLSAGPLEAIGEVARFVADYERRGELMVTETALGRSFCDGGLQADFLGAMLQNPTIYFEGQFTSLFDLTEGMDSDRCRGFLLARAGELCAAANTRKQ